MTLDLKSNCVVTFGFNTTVSLTEDIRARIADLGSKSKNENIFIEEKSEILGGGVRVFASIFKDVKSDNKFNITVNYKPYRRTMVSKKSGKNELSITELFTLLSSLQQECKFECRLMSQFHRRDKAIPIVKLPLKLTESPNATFSEIRGIHLNSKDGADSVDVVLDTSLNVLQEVVIFNYSQRFSQSIAEEILNRGLELAKLYVVRGK